jgi:hypothetical protein
MFVQERLGDRRPIREAAVDGALPHAGGAGDVVHRHALGATLGEQFLGRDQHASPVACRVRPFTPFGTCHVC